MEFTVPATVPTIEMTTPITLPIANPINSPRIATLSDISLTNQKTNPRVRRVAPKYLPVRMVWTSGGVP